MRTKQNKKKSRGSPSQERSPPRSSDKSPSRSDRSTPETQGMIVKLHAGLSFKTDRTAIFAVRIDRASNSQILRQIVAATTWRIDIVLLRGLDPGLWFFWRTVNWIISQCYSPMSLQSSVPVVIAHQQFILVRLSNELPRIVKYIESILGNFIHCEVRRLLYCNETAGSEYKYYPTFWSYKPIRVACDI